MDWAAEEERPGQVARPVLLSFRQLGVEQEVARKGRGGKQDTGSKEQEPGGRRKEARPLLLSFRELVEERVKPLTRRATVRSKQSCQEKSSSVQDKSNLTQSNTNTLEVTELEQIRRKHKQGRNEQGKDEGPGEHQTAGICGYKLQQANQKNTKQREYACISYSRQTRRTPNSGNTRV